ncbi:uncharacterized protein LOC134534264 isoform X2 [Bacillus rossius redtenbacheri]
MIRRRIECHDLFTGKRGSALAGWQRIAELLDNGATYQQCKKKWENLLQKYRDVVATLAKDEPLDDVRWRFFEDLHPFLWTHQHANLPPACKSEHPGGKPHTPRLLFRGVPLPLDAEEEDPLGPNCPATPAPTRCKLEPNDISNFECDEVDYDSELDDDSAHNIQEAEQVPVEIEITEPACAATTRKVPHLEFRGSVFPPTPAKRPRISEACEGIAGLARESAPLAARKTVFGREQHRQMMATLQMEHRMRRNVLQAELEMTKRILQVEFEIRQEELDFRRNFHRLQLRKLAQSINANS